MSQEDPGRIVPQSTLVDSATGLVLRPIALGDAQRVFEACQDPLLQRYTAVPVPYLWEHAEQLTSPANQPAFDRRESADFAITTTGDLFDGVVGVKSADWVNRVAEVGFWLGPWARGRGSASSALALLREWVSRKRVWFVGDSSFAGSAPIWCCWRLSTGSSGISAGTICVARHDVVR